MDDIHFSFVLLHKPRATESDLLKLHLVSGSANVTLRMGSLSQSLDCFDSGYPCATPWTPSSIHKVSRPGKGAFLMYRSTWPGLDGDSQWSPIGTVLGTGVTDTTAQRREHVVRLLRTWNCVFQHVNGL